MTSTVTTRSTSPHYRDHLVAVVNDPEHGWMTEMRDPKGKVLATQYHDPPIAKDAVIERAITLAAWFGVEVRVEDVAS